MPVSTLSLLIVLAAPGAKPETGTLTLLGAPPGASVVINGEPVGVTPLPGPWTLVPGTYDVKVGGVEHVANIFPGEQKALRIKGAAKADAPKPIGRAAEVQETGAGFPLATTGYVTAGLGLLALGGGAFFGLEADDLATQAKDLDRSDPGNTRMQQNGLANDAESAAFRANLLYGVGGVLVLSGAAMILLGRDGPLGDTAVAPMPGGMSVGGRF